MKEVTKRSMQHYKEMIKASKKFPEDALPSATAMYKEANATWNSLYCPHCEAYRGSCSQCELKSSKGCCNGLWRAMATAFTWKEWRKYAKKVRRYIKRVGVI